MGRLCQQHKMAPVAQWVAARSFRATSARSRFWQKRFVLRVKRRVREVQMDFSLNPRAKLPHRGRLSLLVFSGWRRRSGKHS